MKTTPRRRIASDIADLVETPTGTANGFSIYDIAATINCMEARADQNLDQMVTARYDTAISKEYSTLLLAACRYTAAVNGQKAAQVEMEAATDHLITLGAF